MEHRLRPEIIYQSKNNYKPKVFFFNNQKLLNGNFIFSCKNAYLSGGVRSPHANDSSNNNLVQISIFANFRVGTRPHSRSLSQFQFLGLIRPKNQLSLDAGA